MTLTQLSDHAWIFPHAKGFNKTQPNIGIIVDEQQTVLIDAGNGAPHAEQIKTAVFKHRFPPISQIIYTHFHWDHVFGAHCFKVPVIANQRSVPFLGRQKQFPWGEPFLQTRWQKEPLMRAQVMEMLGAAGDWAQFDIVMPDLVFDNTFTLTLPTVSLQLTHVGGIHALDSIVVEVKNEGVMFVGDAYYPPPTYEQEPGEADVLDLNIIASFMKPEIDLYVDGHNKPFTTKQLQYLMRFQAMRMASKEKAGLDMPEYQV